MPIRDLTEFAESSAPKKNVIDFDTELLPGMVGQYVKDVAERMDNAPLAFAGATALWVLSAAIGRRVMVRPKRNDSWTVVPNLWGCLIAPPSIKKSPILSEFAKVLIRAEIGAAKAYGEAMDSYSAEMEAFKEAKKMKETPAPEGADTPKAPIRKRYVLQDATIEAAAVAMKDNPHGLGVIVDELSGFLKNMERSGREADRGFWLESFSGDQGRTVDRIQRGNFYVPYVCASIYGTIQPDIISGLVTDTKNGGSGGDGFLQRFQLMVMQTESDFKYSDRRPNLVARDKYDEIVNSLLETDPGIYGAKSDEYDQNTRYFRFSKEASELYRLWAIENHKKIETEQQDNPALSAHLGKYPSLFASIALILFYVDRVTEECGDQEIPEAYAQKAKRWCEFLESHARQVYDIERIKEEKREALEEKIIAKVRELEMAGSLPMAYGKIAEKVRGANADACKKALDGVAVVKGRKVHGLL
jgi:hypothetical protein